RNFWQARDRKPAGFSDVALDERGQLGLGEGADLGGFQFAALEQHQGGNAPHAELGGGGGVGIHIDLADLDLAGVLVGELVQQGCDHFARSAPDGPEIHQYWDVGTDHVAVKARIGHVNDVDRKST